VALALLGIATCPSKAMWKDNPAPERQTDSWRQEIERILEGSMGADLQHQLNRISDWEKQLAREERNMLEQATALIAQEAQLTGSIAKPSLDLLLFTATVNKMGMPMDDRLLQQRMHELEAVEATVSNPPSTALSAQLGRLAGELKGTLQRRGRAQQASASSSSQSVMEEIARIMQIKQNELTQREAALRFITEQHALLDSELRRRAKIMRKEEYKWHNLATQEQTARLNLLATQQAALRELPKPPATDFRARGTKRYPTRPLPPPRGRIYDQHGRLLETYKR